MGKKKSGKPAPPFEGGVYDAARRLWVRWETRGVCTLADDEGVRRVVRSHESHNKFWSRRWYTVGEETKVFGDFDTAVCAAFDRVRVIQKHAARHDREVIVQFGGTLTVCPLDDPNPMNRQHFIYEGVAYKVISHDESVADYRVLTTTLTK